MKRGKLSFGKFISGLALAAVLMAGTVPALANNDKTAKVNGKIPVELKYVGKIKSDPVLMVQGENANAEELYITLRDKNGELLYSFTTNEKNFSKKFQFQRDYDEAMEIRISIASKGNTQTEVFKVAESTQVINQVLVSKL